MITYRSKVCKSSHHIDQGGHVSVKGQVVDAPGLVGMGSLQQPLKPAIVPGEQPQAVCGQMGSPVPGCSRKPAAMGGPSGRASLALGTYVNQEFLNYPVIF